MSSDTPSEAHGRTPELLLAAVTVLWSSTFIVNKAIVRASSPLAYLTARFTVAAVLLLALTPSARRALLRPREARSLVVDGAVLGLLNVGGLLFQVLGQAFTSASKTAFIASLSTTFTPIVALALYRDRPTRAQAAGVLVATFGLWLLTYPRLGDRWNTGDLLVALSSVIYAFVIVETGRRARRHGSAPLVALQLLSSALLYALLFGVTHALLALLPPDGTPLLLALERRPILFHGRALAALAYMGVVCTVLTLVLQTWALARMTAAHGALVLALEPVWATLIACVVDGASEWPGARGGAGMGLVLLGVVAAELARRSSKPVAATSAAPPREGD